MNNIVGINHNELSTPKLYASDKIKMIDIDNVTISLYFIYPISNFEIPFFLKVFPCLTRFHHKILMINCIIITEMV